MVRFLVCVEGKAIVLSSEDCVIPYHYKTKFIQFYLPQTVLTPAITLFNSADYLPQTVPAVVAVVFPVTEDKALPQTRPPLVIAAIEMAAMAAVSAPGI